MLFIVDLLTFGVELLQINAQETNSMVVREMLLQVATSSTLFKVLVLELLTLSVSSTEELKFVLSFPVVIGYGQPFGCCPSITHTEDGLLQEKSILWNQEETIHHTQKVVIILSVLLFIGDLTMP